MRSLKGLSVRVADIAYYSVFENCLFSISKKSNVILVQGAYKTSIQSAAITTRNKYCLSGKDITFRVEIRGILLCTINPYGNKIIVDALLKPLHIISI